MGAEFNSYFYGKRDHESCHIASCAEMPAGADRLTDRHTHSGPQTLDVATVRIVFVVRTVGELLLLRRARQTQSFNIT
jgi:hypothetical protein